MSKKKSNISSNRPGLPRKLQVINSRVQIRRKHSVEIPGGSANLLMSADEMSRMQWVSAITTKDKIADAQQDVESRRDAFPQ